MRPSQPGEREASTAHHKFKWLFLDHINGGCVECNTRNLLFPNSCTREPVAHCCENSCIFWHLRLHSPWPSSTKSPEIQKEADNKTKQNSKRTCRSYWNGTFLTLSSSTTVNFWGESGIEHTEEVWVLYPCSLRHKNTSTLGSQSRNRRYGTLAHHHV